MHKTTRSSPVTTRSILQLIDVDSSLPQVPSAALAGRSEPYNTATFKRKSTVRGQALSCISTLLLFPVVSASAISSVNL
jgi:hypothetical protein